MEEPAFSSDPEALHYYRCLARSLKSELDNMKLALEESRASSKELETELEKELQGTEKQLKDLRGREESLLHEIDQWKTKYHTSLKDHTKTMSHMQTELESCRKSNEEYRTRLRDMELDNDELEGKERMVTSSLQDVETKFGKAIERITLLEDEIIGKSKLEEEHQRLKDDFRDMTEELAILREHLASSSTTRNNTLASQGQLRLAHVSSSPSSSPITVRESSNLTTNTNFPRKINNKNSLLPRRKASVNFGFDLQKLNRPLSIQDNYQDQQRLRRKSTGLVHSSSIRRPSDLNPPKSYLNHSLLGKSLNNSSASRSYPLKKS